jgi:hypothetical protein
MLYRLSTLRMNLTIQRDITALPDSNTPMLFTTSGYTSRVQSLVETISGAISAASLSERQQEVNFCTTFYLSLNDRMLI